MRQHQTVTSAVFRTMKKPTHRRIQPIIAKGLAGSCHAPGAAETENCELRTSNWVLGTQSLSDRRDDRRAHFIANRQSCSAGGGRGASRASYGVFAARFRAPPRP